MPTDTSSITPDAAQRPIAAAFDKGQVPTIACVNAATVDLGVPWAKMVETLAAYADLFAKVWGTPAKVVDAGKGPVPKGAWGLVFIDTADVAGALGYHDLTKDGLPLSKIFAKTTIADGEKVSVTATHELAEMLVDPGIQLGASGPDGTSWYAYETADAVEQDEFDLAGVPVSNFVYPSWFEGFRKPHSTKFDYLGLCTAAFQLRPGGYISIFRNGTWNQVFGSQAAEQRFKLTAHPRAELRKRVIRHHSDQ